MIHCSACEAMAERRITMATEYWAAELPLTGTIVKNQWNAPLLASTESRLRELLRDKANDVDVYRYKRVRIVDVDTLRNSGQEE